MINQILSHIDYNTLFNSLGEGIVFLQKDGRIAFINKKAEQIFSPLSSFTTDQSIYRQQWTLFDKQGRKLGNESFPAISVLKTGQPVHNMILSMESAKGEVIWIDANADPVLSENREGLSGVILTASDLTDTMKEKQRLRTNEEKYRSFLHSNKSATFLATRAGEYLDASEGAEAIFGYTKEELKKLGRDRLLVQDAKFYEALQQRESTGSVVAEVHGLRKDGSTLPLLWHANIFTTPSGEELVSALMVDMTERNEMEQKARRSAYNLELILKNSDDAFLITDEHLRVVTFNEAYRKTIEDLFGTRVRENMYVLDLGPDELREEAKGIFRQVLNGEKITLQRRYQGGTGENVFELVMRPLWQDDKVVGCFVMRKNITDIVRAKTLFEDLQFNLDLVMRNSEDGIAILDSNFIVQAFNAPFSHAMQIVHHRPISNGDFLPDLFNPERSPLLLERFREVLQGKKKELLLETNIEEEPLIYNSTLTPLYRNGQVIGIFILTRDITDAHTAAKETAEANERLERASIASYDIISERNLLTGELKRNKAFSEILGYDETVSPDTEEDALQNLIHPDDQQAVQKSVEEQITAGKSLVKLPIYRARHKDGHYVYFDARMLVTRDMDGRPCLLTTVSSDVSDFIKLQQALQEANHELQKQTEDLKRSNADLERFAYVASHDLQEPLRMVSSFLGLIKKRYDEKLDETGRQFIHYAVDGAARMKSLIQDLLQFSRIGTTADKKEGVDTRAVVNHLLNEFVFSIREKDATIRTALLPVVVGQKGLLMQVFQNLISNALKYTEAKPYIEIGATDGGEHWIFFVKDNGIGIEERFFEKIFVIFQQLDVKNKGTGTGIGLAIVKKIVEQHGGKIWVESKTGTGSSFYFTLPKEKIQDHEKTGPNSFGGR